MAERSQGHEDQSFAQQKQFVAKFYMDKVLPKADFHIAQVSQGDDAIMAMPADLF